MRSSRSYCRRVNVKLGGFAEIDVDRDVINEPEYEAWRYMLRRCDPTHKDFNGGLIGESFRLYSSFYDWFSTRRFDGCNIDKDIKVRFNKTYSAETCLVVTSRMNKAFQFARVGPTGYPGVTQRENGNFCVSLSTLQGRHRETFKDARLAHARWQISRAETIEELSLFESGEVRPFVISRANYLRHCALNLIKTIGAI